MPALRRRSASPCILALESVRTAFSAALSRAARNWSLAVLRQGPGTSEDVARFWLTYLGCQLAEEPRVSTRKWFDASLTFANEQITDAVTKHTFYEHIHSELKSNRRKVSPRQFIEDYVPPELRVPYKQFLQDHKVTLHSFPKDVSEIRTRLRRKALHTAHGISITVP